MNTFYGKRYFARPPLSAHPTAYIIIISIAMKGHGGIAAYIRYEDFKKRGFGLV